MSWALQHIRCFKDSGFEATFVQSAAIPLLLPCGKVGAVMEQKDNHHFLLRLLLVALAQMFLELWMTQLVSLSKLGVCSAVSTELCLGGRKHQGPLSCTKEGWGPRGMGQPCLPPAQGLFVRDQGCPLPPAVHAFLHARRGGRAQQL